MADGQGPLELRLQAGQMTGTWSLNGIQTIGGTISGSSGGTTANISIIGEGTYVGSGQMSGPPADYRLTGSLTSTNTVAVNVPGIATASETVTDTNQLDEALTEVVVLCQDIYGRWDLRIRQQIQEAGFDEFIRGYFTASTGVDATEQAEAVEELLTEVARWAGDASSIGSEPGERALYMGRALNLLDRSQRLQAELSADSPCPPDPTFASELTLAAQDVLNALIDRYPHITNTTLVAFGLGTGAIGAGSASPEVAEALQAKMEADVSDKFDEFFADWVDGGTTDADIVNVVRTAQALGMETLGDGGLTPTDFLLVMTGESE